MQRFGRLAPVIGAAVGLVCVTPVPAAYVVTFNEVGSDVVATGSGSLNLTALSFVANNRIDRARVAPSPGTVGVGPTTNTELDAYTGYSGSSAFGTGTVNQNATAGSGAIVFFSNVSRVIDPPRGYVSGTDLGISTATFANSSFASIGLTPGRYVYTWGSGPTADSFTVVVPEPAGLALAGVAFAGLAARRRRA